MYEVVADDGMGNVVKLKLSRDKLCSMIGSSLLQGVLATQEIEGEGRVEARLKEPVNLPEKLLHID